MLDFDAAEEKKVSFEDVVSALKRVEVEHISTPLGLLRRLEEYRFDCEGKGDYLEARRARTKMDQMKSKELARQKRLIESAQAHEVAEVEAAQKEQFLDFSSAWDRYMRDYEATAYLSLEKLKEQQAEEFSELSEGIGKQPRVCKFSPELLELRRKQKVLGKLGKYEDATKIKNQSEKLEKMEIAK